MATVERLSPDATPGTPEEIGAGLVSAWWDLWGTPPPSKASIAVLLAQWALETAWGRACHAWNLGNVKSVDGDGRSYCYFACNEILDPGFAKRLAGAAKPRTDLDNPKRMHPQINVDVAITSVRPDGKCVVWFYPDNAGCRFRAFHTLAEGCVDYLGLLNRRFFRAWPAVVNGDPAAYVHALKMQGYFTADESSYLSTVMGLFKKFMALDISLDKPADPAPSVDRDQVLALVAQTNAELISGLVTEAEHTYVERDDSPTPES